MSSAERRHLKRKAEESHEQEHGRSKTAKEARTEVLVMGYTKAANIGILTLADDDWACLDSSPPLHDTEATTSVSKREENKDGSVSCGVMWRGDEGRKLDSTVSQVCLSCKREANGKKFNCGTQTYHFLSATSVTDAFALEFGCKTEASKQAALASVNLKNVKVEVPDDQEYSSHPLVCCVRNCGSRSNEVDSIAFYAVPHNKELKLFWADVLDIIVPDSPSCSEQYVCSLHFITPQKLPVVKTKTRKKKTCDMLLAEEAEKIKQGLSAGRPKRTPKPNKNYDWAELAPYIKTELSDPDEMELMPVSKTQVKSTGLVGRRRKQAFTPVKKEDKENEMPSSDIGPLVFENEGDEYGENVSLPSNPRAPPPKPKGRPHRIRDTCTQTDALHGSLKQPLREVKVQCNLTTEPLISCPNCSIINWTKLEEQLIDCLTKIEGELCDPMLSECLRNVVSDLQEPTHATNVLKLLSGLERDSLEGTKDIILVSSQDDEVEIENVIHPEVEAPMTGLREITPKLWQENTKWKKEIEVEEDVLEDDPDGLGLQEATEVDDDEFHPGFPEPDDEEEDLELDDEDWNINKRDSDSGVSSSKRKQKKVNQRCKKEQTLAAGEAGAGIESSSKADVESSVDPETPSKQKTLGRRRRQEGDTRWIRREHPCHECDMVFSTQRKFDLHFSHIHLGVAPWQGEHICADCGKTFTQKISLKVHRMFKHGAPRRYQCTKCTYEGPTKEYLKRHMKVHTDERQFICPECGKGLKTAESYRNHLVIHTNEGRFFCEVCSKAYNHKGAYEDHQRSHQDDRDYACNYCGAAFKAYKHVARHIRAVHLNDKRFICDVCGAQHMTGFNLKGHIKKHGDISDLPYVHQCTSCDAKFRGSEGLKTHMRMEHKIVSNTGEQSKAPEEKIITPHPTRRPVRFQYSRLSSSILGEGSSKTYHPESNLETIYIDGDTFVVCDEKASDVVYEVYSTGSEEHNTDPLISSDEVGGQRIINVFPCSICHTMFTSEMLLHQHHTQVHPSHNRKPASSE